MSLLVKRCATILVFLLFVSLSSTARAQVALNAPPEDTVYQAIDIFIANDLVRDVIMGQRPFSRMEVARILRKSRESLEQWKRPDDNASAARIGRWLSKRSYLDRFLTYYEHEYGRAPAR